MSVLTVLALPPWEEACNHIITVKKMLQTIITLSAMKTGQKLSLLMKRIACSRESSPHAKYLQNNLTIQFVSMLVLHREEIGLVAAPLADMLIAYWLVGLASSTCFLILQCPWGSTKCLMRNATKPHCEGQNQFWKNNRLIVRVSVFSMVTVSVC